MEGGSMFLILVTACLFATGMASQSELHQRLRRAITQSQERMEPTACNDNSLCDTTPNVCTADVDLGMALCPAKCGACVCEDNTGTQGNCSDLIPEICEGEFGATLCPKTCGLCGKKPGSCFDHVTGIKCSDLPDPCSDALGKVACPKFCGFCVDDTKTTAPPPTTVKTTVPTTATTTTKPTTQPTTTTTKANVPSNVCTLNPCLNNGVCMIDTNQPHGYNCDCPQYYSGLICQVKKDVCTLNPCLNNGVCKIATNQPHGYNCDCPQYYSGLICQVKEVPTTTTQPTTTTSGGAGATQPPADSCLKLKDQNSLPCQEGEVIFLIEYSKIDSTGSIDHEGDFVKELVDAWNIESSGIRFGVVIYHDTVTEAIHITDFKNDPDGLKDRITRLARGLRPSGDADLAKALDYVRENSFKNARPGAVKVAIPIIHQMTDGTKNNIEAAAQRLKDSCVSIVGVTVGDNSLDYEIIHNAVSQPYASFYSYYRSFYDMENAAKWVHYYYPGCHPTPNTQQNSGAGVSLAPPTAAETTTHHYHHNGHHNGGHRDNK